MQTKEETEKQEKQQLNGDIIFKNVTIKANENTIIEKINLQIKSGENIAVIGDNGVRKNSSCQNAYGIL